MDAGDVTLPFVPHLEDGPAVAGVDIGPKLRAVARLVGRVVHLPIWVVAPPPVAVAVGRDDAEGVRVHRGLRSEVGLGDDVLAVEAAPFLLVVPGPAFRGPVLGDVAIDVVKIAVRVEVAHGIEIHEVVVTDDRRGGNRRGKGTLEGASAEREIDFPVVIPGR